MKKALIFFLIFAVLTAAMLSFSACNGDVDISFNSNGGTHVDSVEIHEGTAILPSNPTKEGYVFDGWYFDNGVWEQPCDGTNLAAKLKDFTVYAKWVMAGFTFTRINSTSYAVEEFSGTQTDVVIPSKFRNISVTTIAGDAFYGLHSLFSLEIPNSVSVVQEGAINGCYTTTLLCKLLSKPSGWDVNWNSDCCPVVWNSNENSVADDGYTYFTAEDSNRYAVNGSAVKFVRYTDTNAEFTVPSTVKFNKKTYDVSALGNYAFADCAELERINLPNSVSAIGSSAFLNCAKLEKFDIDSNISFIGQFAFSGCESLTDILIPSTVLNIGSEVFNGCSAIAVYCASAAKPSNWNAEWALNSDTRRTVPVYWSVSNATYAEVNDMQFILENGKAILSKYIGDDDEVEIPSEVTIGGSLHSVSSVGAKAFAGNKYIETIALPDNISSLGYAAFDSCSALSTVTISANIASIEADAFSNCDALLSISIPASVTYLGADIFNGSNNLVINCEAGVKPGGWRFDWNYENGQASQRTVNWGCNNVNADSTFDYAIHNDNVYLTKYKGASANVTVPSFIGGKKVVSIGNIFQGNESLLSITIPDTVKRISDYAFYKCLSLKNVDLPSSIVSIGEYAFSGTAENGMALETVNFSREIKLETIGNSAFAYCPSLYSFNMSEKIYSLGDKVFYGCSSLNSIVLRNTVTEIGENAFFGCENLTAYCEMDENAVPSNWNTLWSNSLANIVWSVDTDRSYTVNVYYQNISDDGFSLYSSEVLIGAVGSTVFATVRNVDHFTFVTDSSSTSGTIELGSDLVLSLYYTRDKYTVVFLGNNGSFVSGDTSQSVKFGASAAAPVFARVGYTFGGWSGSIADITDETTVYAVWIANTDTPYTVEYYFENLYGSDFAVDSFITENLVGTTDVTAQKSAQTFDHFVFDETLSNLSGNIDGDGSLVLKLYYKRETYDVTFGGANGSLVSGAEIYNDIKYGISLSAPVYARTGYTQNGWSGSFDCISADANITPVWVANTNTAYTVYYYFENISDCDFTLDSGLTENLQGTTDQTALKSAPSFEHFVLDETDSVLSGNIGGDGSLILTVYYKRETYTVTFSGANGTLASGTEQYASVKYGSSLSAPVYTRAGYTQNGWSGSFDSISANTEITPVWTANTDTPYAVKFYFENIADSDFTLDSGLTENLTGTTDETAAKTAPSFEHFVLDETASTLSGNIDGDGSLTIELYYKREVYTVHFDRNCGTLSNGNIDQNVKYQADASAPIFTRSGYDFSGWSGTFLTVEENLEISAQWTARTDTNYTIEFRFENLANSLYTTDDTKTQKRLGTTDTTATVASIPVYEHFTYSETDSYVSGNIDGRGILVLYVCYKRDVYTVSFSGNGGTFVMGFETQSVKYEASVSGVNYVKTGYTQNGWTEELTNISSDISPAPIWEANDNTLTFNSNGGSGATVTQMIKTDASAILTLNTYTRSGYTFTGWAKTASGEVLYSDGDEYTMGTSNASLYAVWEIITYYLTYTLNSGTLQTANPSTYTVESGAITLNLPTRRGYTFGGWYTDSGFSGNPYTAIPARNVGNLDFYAKWTADSYSITYNLNGGGSNANPTSYTIEDANITLSNPSLSGCEFVGWYDANSINGNKVTVIKTTLLQNYTLYAIWKYITSGIEYVLANGTATMTSYVGEGGEVTIPSSIELGSETFVVTAIDDYSFDSISTITAVTIEEGITAIGAYAFENCVALKSVSIPSSVNSISTYAFYNCSALASVYIPTSVATIGESAFEQCTSLIALCGASSIPENWNEYWNFNTLGIVYWGVNDNNFININGMQFVVSNSKATLARYVGSSTSETVPDSVTVCGSSYPVESVGMFAFANCTLLVSLSIPAGVTSIGSRALYGCSSLGSLTLPFVGASATASNGSALFGYIFGGATYDGASEVNQTYRSGYTMKYYIPYSLASVVLTNATSLKYGAFSGCTMLTSVTVNGTVASIGDYAFSDCTALSGFSFSGSAVLLGAIGTYAFNNCSSLTSMTIPETVTEIGEYAFSGCSSLTITCEIAEADVPIGWDEYWNYDNCTVVWAE